MIVRMDSCIDTWLDICMTDGWMIVRMDSWIDIWLHVCMMDG
jgi:hypothetical protein